MFCFACAREDSRTRASVDSLPSRSRLASCSPLAQRRRKVSCIAHLLSQIICATLLRLCTSRRCSSTSCQEAKGSVPTSSERRTSRTRCAHRSCSSSLQSVEEEEFNFEGRERRNRKQPTSEVALFAARLDSSSSASCAPFLFRPHVESRFWIVITPRPLKPPAP